MMQTYNTVLDFQMQMPQKTEQPTKTDSSDKKNSFTEALGQELSQKQEPENDKLQGDGEMVQNPEEKPETGNSVIPLVPGLMQNPYIQQAVMGNQAVNVQPAVTDTAEAALQQSGNISQSAGVEVMPEVVSQGATAAPQSQAKNTVLPEGNRQTGTSQVQGLKTDGQETLDIQIQPVNQGTGDEQGKAETDTFKSMFSNTSSLEQESAENLKDIKNPEMVQTGRSEVSFSKDIAAKGPEAVSKSTVDMTDMKAGLQKLSQTMADQMAKGKSEFEIWLEPANLGKLAIKVAYEGGRAMVSIMCMNDKTMELISQNAKSLGTILEQHTGNNTVVVVEHPESDYLQQKADQDNQEGYQQEQAKEQQEDKEAENQSFLQQLRLGLM